MPPVKLLALSVFLLGLIVAFLAVLVGLVERLSAAAPEIHLDFSSQVDLPVVDGSEVSPRAPLVLFLHENQATGDSYRRFIPFLVEAGFRVRAPTFQDPDYPEELRGLRMFPGKSHVDQALEFLQQAAAEAEGSPLVVFGVSRGAATGLLALDRPEAPPVDAAIFDSAFSSQGVIVDKIDRFAPIYLGRLASRIPQALKGWVTWLAFRRLEARVGDRFLDPLAGVSQLKMPTLFLHGRKDRIGPWQTIAQLEAHALVQTQFFRKTGHNAACRKDPEGYQKAVLEFLEAQGIRGAWSRVSERTA